MQYNQYYSRSCLSKKIKLSEKEKKTLENEEQKFVRRGNVFTIRRTERVKDVILKKKKRPTLTKKIIQTNYGKEITAKKLQQRFHSNILIH